MQDHPTEEWRPVPNWPYEVSNLGRVRRAKRSSSNYTYVGRLLKPQLRGGYPRVRLHVPNKKTKSFSVHTLVADVFLPPKPAGHQINHKDGNKQNNRRENLEYVTPLENARHAWRTGLQKPHYGRAWADRAPWPWSKLTPEQLQWIRSNAGRISNVQMGKALGVSTSTIWRCVRHKTFRRE